MTTRQLEPTPGWCDEAIKVLSTIKEYLDDGAPIYPISGIAGMVDRVLAASKPAPEPLPHEWRRSGVSGDLSVFICPYCWRSDYATEPDKLPPPGCCPARNPKPAPAAKDAELPPGLEALPDAIVDAADNMFDKDPVAMVNALHFANAILAEVQLRIVRHERQQNHMGPIQARKVCREEIGKTMLCEKNLIGNGPGVVHARFYLKPGNDK